jgi:UDP-glucose 4-epimerase
MEAAKIEVKNVMVHVITGGAGFVGVNLVPELVKRGVHPVVLDNLSRGRRDFLANYIEAGAVTLLEVNCAEVEQLRRAFQTAHDVGQVTDVWHLAANSDIPAGVADPYVDLKDTFLTTFAMLVVMREFQVRRLHFASSSAIYGDHKNLRIAENTAPYLPISNYGAMKLASEAQISAASASFLEFVSIFRFPNVVGIPATHGVIVDLIRKLKVNPDHLDVLGNGTQRKAYIHVADLVDAMLYIVEHGEAPVNVFNIGPEDDGVTVRHIAEKVRDTVSPEAVIKFGDEDRGWVGDVPRFRYAVDRLAELGWSPKRHSADAIHRAIQEIAEQEQERRQ